MITTILSALIFLVSVKVPSDTASNSAQGYFIGSMIALLVLGYLIYTLIKPEKF